MEMTDVTQKHRDEIDGLFSMVRPALLAICFMHCKNVIVETQRVDEALQNRTIKRHGIPLTVYKVLNIEPMKTILKAAEHNSTGVKRPLNICRGHFKDYRENSGLFGKVKGLWWWDSHVRGSAEHGVSEHDYNVRAPERGAV